MNVKAFTKKGYDFLHRRVEVLFNRNFLMDEKLRLFFSKNLLTGARKVLLHRIKTDAANETYFAVGGYHIYYHPSYHVNNQEKLLEGITQVLDECFLFPPYFSKEVKIQPGDVVFDLGANIGTMAMEFAKAAGPKGKVYAFEPVVYETLARNVQENKVENVIVVPKGVAEKSYSTTINVSDFCLDSSLVNNEYIGKEFHDSINIEITTLDDFVEQNRIPKVDFIKIDIEGFEELAIRGAHQLILKHKPKWSIASYHTDFVNEKQHAKLVRLLKSYGYQIRECDSRHIFAW